MTCFSDLIGVEFTYGGRGPETYDCWGLVMECYRRWHDVELPDYRSTPDRSSNAAVIAAEGKKLWEPVDRKPGTVLLIRVRGVGCHVGFLHRPTRFLHAMENNGVVEARVETFRNMIIGAYEYVGQH